MVPSPFVITAVELWLTGLYKHVGEGIYLPLVRGSREWETLVAGRPGKVTSHHQSGYEKDSTN